MIRNLMIYRATCDRCNLSHPENAPKSILKTILKRDGWKVTGDNVICPECIAKEVKE